MLLGEFNVFKKPCINYTLVAFIFFLISCEGIVGGDGYLYDSKTKVPLKDVQVVLFLNDNPHDTCVSDSTGFFRGSEFVGCVPDCPCAKIVISKDSFITKTIDFNEYWKKNDYSHKLRDSIIIFLNRNK